MPTFGDSIPILALIYFQKLSENKHFCICHYKDKEHDAKVPPHFNVFVPAKDNYLIRCMITSKIEKRKKYYQNRPSECASLVLVNRTDLDFLRAESIIDCNQAELLTPQEVYKRISFEKDNFKPRCEDAHIPLRLKLELKQAIKNSPIVKPYIKSQLLP